MRNERAAGLADAELDPAGAGVCPWLMSHLKKRESWDARKVLPEVQRQLERLKRLKI